MNILQPAASGTAHEVDALLTALLLISGAVLALVFGLLLLYMFKYREHSPVERGNLGEKSWRLETAWTVATLIAFLGLFIWGALLYVRMFQPPADALRIYVIGKQWMWKIEHAAGEHEINALHVPVNLPVELVMTSEDVIHDFSVPAFRIKHDVLPGRYETLWFKAELPGTYHLYCTQFCGLDHARMTGVVVVMTQPDYARWLEANAVSDSMAAAGQKIYQSLGCSACHGGNGAGGSQATSSARGPRLAGLFGATVNSAEGRSSRADERYIREAILNPAGFRVAGYPALMPAFAGKISEENMFALIAYIKSLPAEPPT
jgi:cytochrome c oxidase subunit 2